MKTKISVINFMLGFLFLVILFHLSILFEIISYEIVWAGKISSIDEMRVFEIVSLTINSLLISVLFLKKKHLNNNTSNKVINGLIWIFVFLFALNTIGNLFAERLIEQVLGTTLTLLSAILCWIIVKKEK